MKPKAYSVLLLFIFTLIPFLAFSQETLTITTYYPSPYGSYKNLNIYNADASTTQEDFTQALTRAGILITTTYMDPAYTPGIFWSTTNAAPTKPLAGIYLRTTSTGTRMYFGTSWAYADGINSDPVVINEHGNVGIGTTNPQDLLHVSSDGINGNAIMISNANSNTAGAKPKLILRRARGTHAALASVSDGDRTGSIEFMPYDGSDFLYATSIIAMVDGTPSVGDVPTNLVFYTNKSGVGQNEVLRLTASGNVGIGAAAPTMKLDIAGYNDGLRLRNTAAGTNSAIIKFYDANWTARDMFAINASMGTGGGGDLLKFQYSPSAALVDAMVINTSGNVGIGTANPTRNLDVNGELRIMKGSNAINFTDAWETTPDAVLNVAEISNDIGIYKTLMIVGNKSAGLGRRVSVWDRFEVTGTAWCNLGLWCGSDIRRKKNIQTLPEGILKKVLKLRGVTFDWRQEQFKDVRFPKERQIGVIAQELEKEFPELIATDANGYKSVAYDRFTAVLLEAIKAQQKEIEGLKEEMRHLKESVKK